MTVTISELIDLATARPAPQVPPRPAAWLMSHATMLELRRLIDDDGAYWHQVEQRGKDHMLGIPIVLDNTVEGVRLVDGMGDDITTEERT